MFAKNLAQPLLENEIFKASYLYYICNSKSIRTCPNQHTALYTALKLRFTEDSVKIIKRLELVSRLQFHYQTVFASRITL